MNETLASVLVSNLIKNAFVHGGEKGEITITLTLEALTIANSGDSALDGAHIFDRFYQGAKKEGSTGLGLALSKAVADRSGMELSYSFINGMHIFRLSFNNSRFISES